ncbi:MAG TPA: hypothetical protein VFZ65_19525 [Planctomycetota bacterium]|nr:hypothetical protein [Planctomycetota bacterium]
MDIPTSVLVTGFLVSTVGFSFFLYGKKQARLPQLVAGLLMMAVPMLLPSVLWISVAGLASIGGVWIAVQTGH